MTDSKGMLGTGSSKASKVQKAILWISFASFIQMTSIL